MGPDTPSRNSGAANTTMVTSSEPRNSAMDALDRPMSSPEMAVENDGITNTPNTSMAAAAQQRKPTASVPTPFDAALPPRKYPMDSAMSTVTIRLVQTNIDA